MNARRLFPVAAIVLVVVALVPAVAHASAGAGAPIPWLDEIVAEILAALVKVLQDLMKGVGILLWAVLKLCGLVGLLGSDFTALFGSVVVEAINAVVSGTVAVVIRGSLMVSLGLLGLSLLAKALWPDLRFVSFQRIVLWGTVIQAFLLNAPAIYTELETMRVDLAEEVAQAVSAGAVPGCSGDTVEVILCIAGTGPAEVRHPEITHLPDTIPPYGGAETIGDLYSHCVYNPPVYYGDPACDPEDPTGDPWQVLTYAQEALGSQALSLILGFLVLAYGVLQMALGLAAGMMFVLFPVAAMFAFYLPLESFPAGVIRNYIAIFLKSVVLLTLAAVVIRLFTVAAGNLISLAAVGLVALLLCGIMAKEAVASLLSNVSFVGSSVGSLGAAIGLTGGGGGGIGYASPESRMAASMIGGPMAQTLVGAPNPFLHSSAGGLVGAVGGMPGRALGNARSAVSAAMGAGTGGVGFLVGAAAAARGASLGSLALGSSAASKLGGRDAAEGFTLGATLGALGRAWRGSPAGTGGQAAAPAAGTTPPAGGASAGGAPTYLRRPAPTGQVPSTGTPTAATPGTRSTSTATTRPTTSAGVQSAPAASTPSPSTPGTQPGSSATTPSAPAGSAIQTILGGGSADLSAWMPARQQQIQSATARLSAAPANVQRGALDLMNAGQAAARRWKGEGREPLAADGSPDPRFVDDVIQAAPAAARAFTVGQAKAGLPAGQELPLTDVVALGAMQPDGTPATAAPAPAPAAPAPATSTAATPAAATSTAPVASTSAVPAASAPVIPTVPAPAPDPVLLAQLRTWRREEADRLGKATFHVFPDATLERIAAARPQTEEDLLAVKGVGPKKMAQFGQGVLDLTRDTAKEKS